MTIHRDKGEITFECDGCDETLDTAEEHWPHAQRKFRDDGWRAEKVGADWLHLCAGCQRRPTAQRARA